MTQDSAHSVSGKGKKRSSSSTEDFECAVCYDLLLDPVVGPCGHDMCLHCYQRWASANGAVAFCPLCRCTLPPNLAVCLRLKKTIERLHPEASDRRRQEVAVQREAQLEAGPDQDLFTQHQQLPTYPSDLPAQWTTFMPQCPFSFFSNMMMAMHQMRRQQQTSAATLIPASVAASELQQASEASAEHTTLASCDGTLNSMLPCWSIFAGSTLPPTVPPTHPSQKRTWQTAADSSIRLEMARAIISTLQGRGWHQTLGSKLADAVRFLELFLYRTAASRESYTNASDLEARIIAAVQQRAAAACARRARTEAASQR